MGSGGTQPPSDSGRPAQHPGAAARPSTRRASRSFDPTEGQQGQGGGRPHGFPVSRAECAAWHRGAGATLAARPRLRDRVGPPLPQPDRPFVDRRGSDAVDGQGARRSDRRRARPAGGPPPPRRRRTGGDLRPQPPLASRHAAVDHHDPRRVEASPGGRRGSRLLLHQSGRRDARRAEPQRPADRPGDDLAQVERPDQSLDRCGLEPVRSIRRAVAHRMDGVRTSRPVRRISRRRPGHRWSRCSSRDLARSSARG